jgi:Tfp pilus assembly protein PilN
MRAVNLLPQTQRRRPGFTGSRKQLAIIGAVALVGIMGFWGYSLHSQVDQATSDVAEATVQRDELRQQLGAYQQLQTKQAAQEVRRGAVAGLVAGRTNWERIVRDLSAVMPRQVWLINLKGETDIIPAGTAPVTATATPAANDSTVPKGIHLDGFAYTQKQVALLMARAGTVAGVGEPRLTSSEVQDRGDRTVIHFVIDIPIDQRAQDRPTLTPVPTSAPDGATP